jgi:Family of unknown function (DUF5681)
MPFQKGTSGNPGGRRKKTETLLQIEALARQYAPQAMEALAKIAMSGKTDSARVAAATAILDRAFGRPSQTLRTESGPKVSYFISDTPLTLEEWAAKHCTGN